MLSASGVHSGLSAGARGRLLPPGSRAADLQFLDELLDIRDGGRSGGEYVFAKPGRAQLAVAAHDGANVPL